MTAPYDSVAGRYDSAMRPLEKYFLDQMRRQALAKLPADADILEVGAGTGANFKYYPACSHAVASELSSAMLGLARDKTETIDLVQADAQALPFRSDRFDAALATLVFCTIPDPDLAFREIIRVVKPGGTVVLLEHVRPPGLLGYVFDALNILTTAVMEDHFNRRTSQAAERAGLRVVDVKHHLLGIVDLIECRVEK